MTDLSPKLQILLSLIEGFHEASEDRAQERGERSRFGAEGGEFVETGEEGGPVFFGAEEGDGGEAAHEHHFVFEVGFESGHHEDGGDDSIVMCRGREVGEDPVFEVFVHDVLMDELRHLLREVSKVDGVARSGGLNLQGFLPFMSDEVLAQFFGVSVDAV